MTAILNRYGMLAALLAAIIFLGLMLVRRSRDSKSDFSLDDLLIGEDGRASKAAAVMFGSFGVYSWVLIYQTLQGKDIDLLAAGYGTLFVAPTIARLITNRPPQPQASVANAMSPGSVAVASQPEAGKKITRRS